MLQTKIQWAHSTANPIMGCAGCELFPNPQNILKAIDEAMNREPGTARTILGEIIECQYQTIQNPEPGHCDAITTTNIWHARKALEAHVRQRFGERTARAALNAIESSVTCYAAKLHLNKGASIFNPERQRNPGYAPVFERVTRFPGRVRKMVNEKRPTQSGKPWLNGTKHLIFLSDMGDALSRRCEFQFLREDVIPAITSAQGSKKIWLWLTKRPEIMADFAEEIGGFPENVCAMTSITANNTLGRVDELRAVQATTRGLSIEPLWERLDLNLLDLQGIDWVIVGGESGRSDIVRPFHAEWAEELGQYCEQNGVAFFLKQLGSKPIYRWRALDLNDRHGGDWDEWPAQLRMREFPSSFRDFAG
jgi:protein gp37